MKQIVRDDGPDSYVSIVTGIGLQEERRIRTIDNKAAVICRTLSRLIQDQHQKTAMVGDRIFDGGWRY